MTNKIQQALPNLIIIFVIFGLGLILKSKYDSHIESERIATQVVISEKALILKKYLSKNDKPERIEILGLSNRFSSEIADIKKLKVSLNKDSDFYMMIQLFTDENDKTAPLIAQIRYIDLKSGNLKKEESINLE